MFLINTSNLIYNTTGLLLLLVNYNRFSVNRGKKAVKWKLINYPILKLIGEPCVTSRFA